MAPDFRQKIVDLPGLRARVRTAREEGKTIVQCHGCFDIVHPGHIRYLQFARRQGDVLVVSLTGDADVTPDGQAPYISQELRAENLAALMFVDLVHVTAGPTAADVLQEVRPDVYVKGREYENSTSPAFLAEKHVIEEYGGRTIFSSGETVFGLSDFVDHTSVSPEYESHRLTLFCRRHRISASSIERTLERFRSLRVLVIGDTVIDRYVMCDALGVASESPVMSLVQRDERSYVGGAAIVARHAAALGARTFLLTTSGRDARSRWMSDVLSAERVDTHVIDSRPALVEKTRFLVDDTKVLKVDRAQRLPLDSVAERRAALVLERQSRDADVVIFCDFGYGTITGSLLQRVLPTLRQNVRTLAADVSGGKANLLNFRHVDLLCPTEREMRTMLNDDASGLSAVAWKLLDQTQASHVFVTLEKRGMVVFERQSQDRSSPDWAGRLRSEQLPSFADRVVDRLGCGDALLAASALALASGDNLMQTAYLGNAAAAIEIARMGNEPVGADSITRWIRTRRELLHSGVTVDKLAATVLADTQPASPPPVSPLAQELTPARGDTE